MKTKINDTYTAGRVWLAKQLELEERNLFDYERPLGPDTTVYRKKQAWWRQLIP